MSGLGTPPFLAHIDGNSVPTITGVVGTLGTSDASGTAKALPVGVNPSSGAAYVDNIGALCGVVLATAVTVANGTATAIPGTTLTNRKTFTCFNSGTTKCWLGGTGVTASDVGGIPVGTQEYSPSVDMGTAIIYGISGTSGGTLTVFEVS